MERKTFEARVGAGPLLVLVALAMLLPGFWTLPPMDRDETRFAQASKQMLETHDFVAIRFGDEARNKKPVGIHWMQAAVVGLAEALDVPDAHRRIWLYRIPSLLGAVAAVLLTYWAALALVSRRGAFLAALIVAATPLLGVEARLATTDAVLAATVAGAMGALARIYLAGAAPRRPLGTAAIFWVSLGLGILIKGPITPMVVGLAAAVLAVRERSGRWLGRLRPLPGLVLCLLIVVPWFVLILLKTNGTFLTEAVGHDFLGKVAGGQEMHGGPPGFYFAAFWLTAWPLAPFAALAAPTVWRHRREQAVVFLLAWVVPAWLVLEAVPTKLVHYALPLYPGVAILTLWALERSPAAGASPAAGEAPAAGRPPRAFAAGALLGLLALVPVAVFVLIVAGQGRLWSLGSLDIGAAVLAVAAAIGLAVAARRALLERHLGASLWCAALGALPIYLFVFGRLLTPGVADSLAVSPRLAAAAMAALGPDCPDPAYATVGDREPSLMFATNGRLLMTDPAGAATFLADGPCRAAFVERREEPPFLAALDTEVPLKEAGRVRGFAINGGRDLDIGVYIRQGALP